VNPITPLAVALCVGAILGYRWLALHRTAGFSPRTEAGYGALGLAAVVASVAVTIAGRTAMLILSPFVMIPAGVYLLRRSDAVTSEFGLNLRRAGWAAIATGILSGVAAAGSLVVGS